MATRSFIGVLTEDCIKAVYCHWDGYPENNGKILNEHYTKDDTLKLLEFGQISSLGETIESCVFYHRDRGEELNNPEILNSISELIACANDAWAEYVYLFDKEWMVADLSERNVRFVPLIKVLNNVKGEDMNVDIINKTLVDSILDTGGTAVVTFTKKDGTMRTMRATKNSNLILAKPVSEDTNKPKRVVAENPDVAKVYDLDKQEWRSFRYDSIKSVFAEAN